MHERQAGVDHDRELAGEDDEIRRGDAAAEAEEADQKDDDLKARLERIESMLETLTAGRK